MPRPLCFMALCATWRFPGGAFRALPSALPSATNFVAIDCHRDGAFARRLLAALADEGIFARMPGVAPMDRCIRVSCGPEAELAAFADALPRALRAAD